MPGSYISTYEEGEWGGKGAGKVYNIAGDNNQVSYASSRSPALPAPGWHSPLTGTERTEANGNLYPFFAFVACRHYLKISKPCPPHAKYIYIYMYMYAYRNISKSACDGGGGGAVLPPRVVLRLERLDIWLQPQQHCRCPRGEHCLLRGRVGRGWHAHISAWYDSLTTLNLHCSCRSLFMEKERRRRRRRRRRWKGVQHMPLSSSVASPTNTLIPMQFDVQRILCPAHPLGRLLTIKVIEKYFPSHFPR